MVQLMGNWKKVEMWPLQRGSPLAKVARIRRWKTNSGQRRTNLLLLEESLWSKVAKANRWWWNLWNPNPSKREVPEQVRLLKSSCHISGNIWKQIHSLRVLTQDLVLEKLGASRHSCCYCEALHRRNDSSAVFQSQRSDIWTEKNCSDVGRKEATGCLVFSKEEKGNCRRWR